MHWLIDAVRTWTGAGRTIPNSILDTKMSVCPLSHKNPVQPVSDFRGGTLSLTKDGVQTEELLVSKIGLILIVFKGTLMLVSPYSYIMVKK